MGQAVAALWLWGAAALLSACNPAGDDPSDVVDTTRPSDTGSDTADTGEPWTGSPGLWASCTPQKGNNLRFWCDVTVDPPQPVQVAFAKADGTGLERIHTSAAIARSHRIGLYLMAGDTPYDFTVTAADGLLAPVRGQVTTGVPPVGARVDVTSRGTPSFDLVGFGSPCNEGANLLIVDMRTEQVVWYEDVAISFLGFIDAVSFTDDGTILTIVDSAVLELDPMGQRVFDLFPGGELGHRVHHDIFRKNGLTYIIFQELLTVDDEEYLLDGFYIYDAQGSRVGEWHLVDHFVPVDHNGSLFADDYSHANAIWVDDDDQILFSMRHLSAIASIEGDLSSPEFGTIRWRLSNPDSDFGSDFTLSSLVPGPANFEQQHNVHFLPDGTLSMFDNRIGFEQNSRVIDVALDAVSNTATIVKAYELPEHCDYQGSAWRTGAGNPLATCAPSRAGYEFDESTGAVAWDGAVSCFTGFGSYVARLVPVDW